MECPKSLTWEDNIGTQYLANSKEPLMTSRTKHIGINYHWFRSEIKCNKITMVKVSTQDQQVDLFNKGLTKFYFEQQRKIVMG